MIFASLISNRHSRQTLRHIGFEKEKTVSKIRVGLKIRNYINSRRTGALTMTSNPSFSDRSATIRHLNTVYYIMPWNESPAWKTNAPTFGLVSNRLSSFTIASLSRAKPP